MKDERKIFKLKKKLENIFKVEKEGYVEIKKAQEILGYKSYPSFYSHIILPAIKYGLIEKPFRGVIKFKRVDY